MNVWVEVREFARDGYESVANFSGALDVAKPATDSELTSTEGELDAVSFFSLCLPTCEDYTTWEFSRFHREIGGEGGVSQFRFRVERMAGGGGRRAGKFFSCLGMGCPRQSSPTVGIIR
jgi:hypothetical protein